MNEQTRKLKEVLDKCGRFTTAPVSVKLAAAGDPLPAKMRYPLDHVGNRLAVCQGMTLARTFGWHMAFREKDHACPLPRVFMGHVKPDKFLEGAVAEFYQDDPDCMKTMEASYPRWPMKTYEQIWLSPADRCEFTPDLMVVYGSPAQILTLVQAANYGKGAGLTSVSTGRYGCATWIAGAIQADECTYMIPGPGERVFAGTQDHEMSFAAPYSQFEGLMAGLEYIRGRGAYRFPVPNLAILAEPRVPKQYHSIIADDPQTPE